MPRTVSPEEINQRALAVEIALQAAYREAVIRHKQGGVPLVVSRNGKTVEIPPEELVIPPEVQLQPCPLID